MENKNDILQLLEEVQTIVHNLRDEKNDLRDQMSRLEAQLSLVMEEKTKGNLNEEEANLLKALLSELRLAYVEAKG